MNRFARWMVKHRVIVVIICLALMIPSIFGMAATRVKYDLLYYLPEDLDTIEELCLHIKQSALCGLGQTAPNPVLSTLRHFREEYEAHVIEKRCPAKVCRSLIQYVVDPTKCKGCTRCAQGCPTGAISGAVRAPHIINQSKCIKCGACMDHCRFDAISKQ